MEALLVLLGLALLALPVAVIVLIIRLVDLRRTVRALSARTDALAAQLKALTAIPAAAVPELTDTASQSVPPPVGPDPHPPVAPVTSDAAPARSPEPRPQRAASPLAAHARRLALWLRENWFYAIAAVSLALAGIFLVQYGVETGLLSPPLRVAAALTLGSALIAAGERIRRRPGEADGDTEATTTAYLPSTLSSAGLVTLMGAILAARLLYDLIAPGPTLGALFATALGGLVLGWRNGPLLAAIGVLGGQAAPFLVGGGSETPEALLPYFALLTALGLGIDTLRRWAWVSVLSLGSGLIAGTMLWLSEGGGRESMDMAFAVFATALAILATLIPARGLTPDHASPCPLQWIAQQKARPRFPVWLALGTTAAACLILLGSADGGETPWWAALTLATTLALLFTHWSSRAPGLQDAALIPAATVLLLLVSPDLTRPLLQALHDRLATEASQTEARMPLAVSLAFLAPLLLTLATAWRSLRGPSRAGRHWAAAAALMAPLGGLALELTWKPAQIIGPWPWALHALTTAALMTLLAERFARADGTDSTDRLRPAMATISALACLAFALGIILTEAALTLSLAATVLAAAALDRRFDLAPMTGYIVAGILALGYRLTVDPGVGWGFGAPFPHALAAYAGTLTALVIARALLAPRNRPRARVFLESAAWSTAALTASVILYHLIDRLTAHPAGSEHWVSGLHASVWLAVALAQLDRLKLRTRLRWLRIGLAAIFGLTGSALLAVALTFGNPLVEHQHVAGPVLLNTLAPAYLFPALILGAGALRLDHVHRILRAILGAGAVTLGALWAALVIRHAFQGADGLAISQGITQPELYTYTLALLASGAALFLRALQHHRTGLRRAALAVIGLAVAKVFLIDAAGLDGLARVFSFLLLGLSLAGLAWLNRWAQMRAT
ncbi:DUF2339 domain-containing protein [Sagittula salina]|uniref:DUF2339 domain-containing protein n=1 Tax=Sagittula salina TaxID=2820268 RepID=A0A940S1C2_9RHOB|nr:DUF2339 domain-containing protein [Sagittula salina]